MPGGHTLQRTADLIEDIEFMVETGASWEDICRRTARKSENLERLLERNERRDLYTKARSRDRAPL